MFVIPGIAALLAFVYIRPQEVFEAIKGITFPMLLAFAGLGYALDFRVKATQRQGLDPLLVLGILFFLWVMVTVTVAVPEQFQEWLLYFAGPAGLFLALSQGVQTLRGLRVVTKTLLAVTLLIEVIAVQQGFSPTVCLVDDRQVAPVPGLENGSELRPCKTRAECAETGVPWRDYLCEHVGAMETSSITGRIRYRGVFQDPNELAWAISLSLPFVFSWFGGRERSFWKRAGSVGLILLVLGISITCNIMTQSRSGQLSLVATLGVYFIKRFRWRGVAVGALLAIPIMLLGGRTDEGAESSTEERLECWAEAFDLWRQYPVFGVGAKQFGEHHYLTAHNSALLALADMGPLGLFLFTAAIYFAFKITVAVQRDFAEDPQAAPARAAAFAVFAGLSGLVTSALFLSLTYHMALWIELGLAGAVYGAVRRHAPDWRVRFSWRDAAAVVGLDVSLVAGIAVYLRIKGVH